MHVFFVGSLVFVFSVAFVRMLAFISKMLAPQADEGCSFVLFFYLLSVMACFCLAGRTEEVTGTFAHTAFSFR